MIVVLGFVVFLLSLYLFTREDFVFAKKNVVVEDIFDIAFLTGLIALLFARIIFVAFHFKLTYLNPLVFFLVPYFPGLGITGTVIGSFFFLLWTARSRKIPAGHLIDVFSASFLYAFSATLLGYGIFSLIHHQFLIGIVDTVWAIISFSLSILFGSILMKSLWKDGNISVVVVSSISVILLITRGVIMLLQKPFVWDKELFIVCLILLGAGVIGLGRKFMQRSIL